MERLSDDQVRDALVQLPGWERAGETITRTFELATFPAAIDFVVRIAAAAEAANHHPDLDIRYRRVRVVLTTHDAGGITGRDVELARAVDAAGEGDA
ncbi:MAG: putative pterin-4-alpha-carbinolamine dehydratase [Acidimicrobiia bacterium]